jgi:hypothetical protein
MDVIKIQKPETVQSNAKTKQIHRTTRTHITQEDRNNWVKQKIFGKMNHIIECKNQKYHKRKMLLKCDTCLSLE